MFDVIGPKRPVSWAFDFWPVFLFSLIGSLIATWMCKKIALKFNIVDRPDNVVKTHGEPIAYLGGIGILTGLVIGVFTGMMLLIGEGVSAHVFRMLLGVLGGAAIAVLIGLADDIFDITPGKKFAGQIIAALAIIFTGIYPDFNTLMGPFGFSIPEYLSTSLGAFIVIFFVLGATNSLNLLDGLDGLCAGVTAIIVFAMLLLSIHLGTWGHSGTGDPVRMVICLGLFGGVCGFLPFNRHPAKIFMGDAGSMLLGFVVAALMMLFAEKYVRWWMASVVVFGLPILDTATALTRRFINKKPLFVSDRGHIYDQMIDRGLSLKRTVRVSYLLAAGYAITGLLMSQIRARYAIIVNLAVFIVSGVIIWKKGYLEMEGVRGLRKKGSD